MLSLFGIFVSRVAKLHNHRFHFWSNAKNSYLQCKKVAGISADHLASREETRRPGRRTSDLPRGGFRVNYQFSLMLNRPVNWLSRALWSARNDPVPVSNDKP